MTIDDLSPYQIYQEMYPVMREYLNELYAKEWEDMIREALSQEYPDKLVTEEDT